VELDTDVLVVGGGLGGVAAALTAVRLGRRVVLT
jgi:succinate dehydrogenase/fumarate reductase flavoprotein subunit